VVVRQNAVHHWIDNFHTGYNLDGLKHYTDATGDGSYRQNFERARSTSQFLSRRKAKYYHANIQSISMCGTNDDTLAFVSEDDPESLALAKLVAAWTIRNMQDRKGYFYYRQYPIMKATTPMLHWGQGTMFKALAHLLLRLASTKQTSVV
jgi:hypothetical protein